MDEDILGLGACVCWWDDVFAFSDCECLDVYKGTTIAGRVDGVIVHVEVWSLSLLS